MEKTLHAYQTIENAISEIATVADKLPAIVVIHDLRDWREVWISERGLAPLDLSLEEIKKLTQEEYYGTYFNLEDAKDYVSKILGLLEANDDGGICTFFQQVRFKPHGAWTWHCRALKS